MTNLPNHPVLYEINTWAWLNELSRQAGRPVTLGSVPDETWDALSAWGFDAVWLMGVWERSPAGIRIAMQNEGLVAEFRRALPDFTPEDVAGSPYCIRNYSVDERLGGPKGLAAARQALSERGMGLVLDFVPNHVAPDHPWVTAHPEYFVLGDTGDLARAPADFIQAGESVIARGRDPYFAPWPDVVQLNAFNPGLREAIIATLTGIASQCDGVRCDMAMLFLNNIFVQTWSNRAGAPPVTEYWTDVIGAVKAAQPGFIFMAEAYWDKEWELQQLGFDYCYDKRLYDRLAQENAQAVQGHLHASLDYQARLVRFIENHDEPRAAATFSPDKQRAAALTVATQMGLRLFHEGQLEGRKVKLPVFLARRPDEPVDAVLQDFYRRLLGALRLEALHTGEWRLCDCSGWPDNASFQNLVAWSWRKDAAFVLVVVNLSGTPAQGQVHLPWKDLTGRLWQLTDRLTGQSFERSGNEMLGPGLYVDLQPWGAHFFTT